jgi:N-6 DNA Methylase
MPGPSLVPFSNFLDSLGKAANETQKRHLFTELAACGFEDDRLATSLALGAEYKVHFAQAGLLRRGSVDSYYGSLIIEFENDLRKSGEHALEQLQAYVAGAWREDGSTDRQYLAVATDGSIWRTFIPRANVHLDHLEPEQVLLSPVEEWKRSGSDDAASLRDFLNRLFYRKDPIKPTAGNFARDFGRNSPAYQAATDLLRRKYEEVKDTPQLAVLQKIWSKSLQLVYGSDEADAELFIRHTYLANLARLLVWSALEHHTPSRSEIEDVLSGKYFRGRQVANLVEDDFFRWHSIPSATLATTAWAGLRNQLAGYDLGAVKEDILKPLYEDLVDPSSRHDLGEYYTPDWLATQVTRRLLHGWDWNKGTPKLLDPTCGSGTFLRTCIDELRSHVTGQQGADLLNTLLSCVMGIDVHPLAVVIARATYLLAIKDLVIHASDPITLPVFLADSLLFADVEYTPSLLERTFPLQLDETEYPVDIDFVRSGPDYEATIEDVIAVARSFASTAKRAADLVESDVKASLTKRVATRLDHLRDPDLLPTLARMTLELAKLIIEERDGIHGFLLKNHYRPAMLRQAFDLVLGNPPWLTISQIHTTGYKAQVVKEATRYKIAGKSPGEIGHIDLATIFLAHSAAVFLTPREDNVSLRLGLVMPRSIFSATQHRLLRGRTYSVAMDIRELWDLANVAPLFNVPSCVAFAAATAPGKAVRTPGRKFEGRLPAKDVTWDVARKYLNSSTVAYELAFLGKRTAWREVEPGASVTSASYKAQPYARRFSQGAILYPQTLLVVQPDRPIRAGQRQALVRTNPAAALGAKLRTAQVNHVVNVENLFRTAAAEHIAPYTHIPPLWMVVLPTLGKPGDAIFGPVSAEHLRRTGLIESADWERWAEKEWERVRKQGDAVAAPQPSKPSS